MSHHVYILKCSDNSYYVGMTANLERRLKEHQSGYRDRSYTSTRRPVELVWSSELGTRVEAMRFERRIKSWTRAQKQALIRGERQGTRKIAKRETRIPRATKR